MGGDPDTIDVGVQRASRALVFVSGFQVEGIDVAHASGHVEIDQLFGGSDALGDEAFISRGGEEIAAGVDAEEGPGCGLQEAASVQVCLLGNHCGGNKGFEFLTLIKIDGTNEHEETLIGLEMLRRSIEKLCSFVFHL